MENAEIARLFTETADLMEIAGEDAFRIRSYRNAASVIEGYPERVADILTTRSASVTDIPGIGKGSGGGPAGDRASAGLSSGAICCCEKYPADGARIAEDPGTRSEEHRAAVRALPGQHGRRTGAHLPGAETARAAAHGRQAGREGAALHRPIPPERRPLSAELRPSDGRANSRHGWRKTPGVEKITAGGKPATRDAKPLAISICWLRVQARRRRWNAS